MPQWAAEEGHIGCVALMLRSTLKKSDLGNALLAAAKHGHEHIVHLLVEAGGEHMHIHMHRGKHTGICCAM